MFEPLSPTYSPLNRDIRTASFFDDNKAPASAQTALDKLFAGCKNATEVLARLNEDPDVIKLGNWGNRVQLVFKHPKVPGFVIKMQDPTHIEQSVDEVKAAGMLEYQAALRVAYANFLRMLCVKNQNTFGQYFQIPPLYLHRLNDAESDTDFSDAVVLCLAEEVPNLIQNKAGKLHTAQCIQSMPVEQCRSLARGMFEFVRQTLFMDGHFLIFNGIKVLANFRLLIVTQNVAQVYGSLVMKRKWEQAQVRA